MTQVTDLREFSEEELQDKVNDAEKKLQKYLLVLRSGGESNTAQVGILKKDIARLKTVLREKEVLRHAKKNNGG